MVRRLNEVNEDILDNMTHDLYNAVGKVMFKYRNEYISKSDFENVMEFVTTRFSDGEDYDFEEN